MPPVAATGNSSPFFLRSTSSSVIHLTHAAKRDTIYHLSQVLALCEEFADFVRAAQSLLAWLGTETGGRDANVISPFAMVD
jgi:hypothetical protein